MIRVPGKRILLYFLLTIPGIAGGLIAFEIYARLALRNEPVWLDRYAFRATQPAPYKGASYFSKAFVQESARSIPSLTNPPGKNELVLDDFRGQWFNVRDHHRVTAYQPSTFQNRIYLFGGSTLFGQEVPDEFTVASYLQKKINETLPDRFRVENWGVPSVMAEQQVVTLQSLRLEPGDKVIFFDGDNDMTYGIYYLMPTGWRPGRDRGLVRWMTWYDKLLLEYLQDWEPRLASLRLLRGRIDIRPPAHLMNGTAIKALLELLARQRTSALLEASTLVQRSGAEFFSFFQPNIFVLPDQTEYRRYVIRNPLLTPPALDLAFRAGGPVMAGIVSRLRTAGVKSADLSQVLTPISQSEEVYFDYCHANHRANEVIANELFRQVFSTSWPLAPREGEAALRVKLGRFDANRLPKPAGDSALARHEFFRSGSKTYAVPDEYGHVWWDGVDVAALPGVISGNSAEEVAKLSHLEDQLTRPAYLDKQPHLLRSEGAYNVVAFRGRIYALPMSLGPVNLDAWEGGRVGALPGVITGATVANVVARLPR